MSTVSTAPLHPLEDKTRLSPAALEIFCKCDAVCMDVDSTVCTSEAIDELAAFAGVKDEVAAMTARAMSGSQSFTEALRARLALIKPSKDVLTRFMASHSLSLTPGVNDFIRLCTRRGVPVYLVSGGFTALIDDMVRANGLNDVIPSDRIFANVILTNPSTGAYESFDETAPTSKDGGKAVVVGRLMAKEHMPQRARQHSSICMIGDGITDAQARPPASIFIGYGGIAVREKVQAVADAYIYSFHTLCEAVTEWDRVHDPVGEHSKQRLRSIGVRDA